MMLSSTERRAALAQMFCWTSDPSRTLRHVLQKDGGRRGELDGHPVEIVDRAGVAFGSHRNIGSLRTSRFPTAASGSGYDRIHDVERVNPRDRSLSGRYRTHDLSILPTAAS